MLKARNSSFISVEGSLQSKHHTVFLFRLLPGNHRIADNLLSVTWPAVVCSAGSVLVQFGYTGII